jgi:chaperone LolA
MRWVYKSGSADTLVSDGKTIWLFQPDLRQVVETNADMGSTIATDFLSGMGNIREDFIVRLAEEKKKVYVLELTPIRLQQNVKMVFLHVDKHDSMVRKTVVEDFFGNSTHVSFTNLELNMPMRDAFFTFKPPPGVTVIKE